MSDTSTQVPAVPVTPEMVRAAQAWDYEHRPRYQPWTRVPNGQVKRLLAGALGPEGAAVPAGELAAFATLMDRAQALLLGLQGSIDAAVEAERERIRQLAVKCHAVTVSPTGRMQPFEELLRHSPEAAAAMLLKVVEDASP